MTPAPPPLGPPHPSRETAPPGVLTTLAAVLISACLVYLGNGLQGVLLPLAGLEAGFPTVILGLMGAAFSVGFVLGCVVCPRIIRRVGHIRALAVFAAITANMLLAYALILHPLAWLLLRVGSGLALAGMFMVIESWLNERATNANRGRIFGAYMVINSASVVAGQMLVSLGDPGEMSLFLWGAILLSLALVPVSLTTATGPAPITDVRLALGRLYRASPVGVVSAILVGVSSGCFGTLGAVLVSRLGFSTTEVALFVSAALAGAALMQGPAGWVSDRVDRRWLLTVLGALSCLVGLWMGLSDGDGPASGLARLLGLPLPWAWILAAGLFGAFAYPLYGISVAHLNDRVHSDSFVAAASTSLLLWGSGAAIGPVLGSLAMGWLGDNALFLVTGLAHAALALFALLRMVQRAAPAAGDKAPFRPTGVGRTTPEAANLDPRAPDVADN